MSKTKSKVDDKFSYSSYWLDDSTGVFDEDSTPMVGDGTTIQRLAKFAAVRRAVANFVRILTNDSSIKVQFSSGKDSYTDGKVVIISADDNVKNFDSMVGLALHEGSHCLLSDFNFLQNLTDSSVMYSALHPTLRNMLKFNPVEYENNNKVIKTLGEHLRLLMNIIEDRRIDSYVYSAAPGYRPYYDAMYTRFFFNKDLENSLQNNPEWRTPTVDNYITWLLSIISPSFTTTALPGLDKMVNLIDLKNIRRFDTTTPMNTPYEWKFGQEINNPFNMNGLQSKLTTYDITQFPLLWQVANELMIMILKYAKLNAKDENVSMGDGASIEISIDMDANENAEMQNELENHDLLPTGRFNADRAKKALNKAKEVMAQKLKKKKLTRAEEKQIEAMESASAEMVENSDSLIGKIPCLITRKLTRDIMMAKWFPFSHVDHWCSPPTLVENRDSKAGVLDGIRMGQILAHRLQLRNDPQMTHFTRQNHGKIDRRILAQLGMDIEQVFKRTTVDTFNPVMLHLSLDASGSMGGSKWKKAIVVATALSYAADKIRNLDVVVSIRGNTNDGLPMVAIVHDSRKDNFNKAKTLFPYLSTSGSTPEGLCFSATMDLIKECTSTHRVFFINFSDGEPGCSYKHNGEYVNYGGQLAYKQTKNMVREMREAGVRIMSYFISDYPLASHHSSHKAFVEMYGADAEFVDVKNATQVLRTLNKLLLVRE